LEKKQLIFTILLLIVYTSLSAGCFETKIANQTGNVSAIGTPPAMITQPVFTLCPPFGNATPWIIINPITSHHVGDVFEINGTTNLGVDKKMMINVDEERLMGTGPYDNPEIRLKYTYTDLQGYVNIRGGECGINSWSYPVNLTGFHGGKSYSIWVFLEQKKFPHDVINYSGFIAYR
jgi:hypothetical protein